MYGAGVIEYGRIPVGVYRSEMRRDEVPVDDERAGKVLAVDAVESFSETCCPATRLGGCCSAPRVDEDEFPPTVLLAKS